MSRPVAPPPELADAHRRLSDRVEQEQFGLAEVLGARPAHDHEPGILRDTVRCAACARAQLDLDEDRGQLVEAGD